MALLLASLFYDLVKVASASWVNRVSAGNKLHFFDRHCKFLTTKITDALNLIFLTRYSYML